MSYFPKLNQLSSLITIITCGAMITAISNNAVANSTSDSSYLDSCQNIQVSRATLSARCTRRNGGSKVTSIPIRGIENRNGNLTYSSSSTDASNYQDSCQNIRINGTTLSARCTRKNGGSKRTSISIRGIKNQNGNLTYSR
jgi:CVNH domain